VRAEMEAPAIEQHHGDVDALSARGDDAVAETLDERLVKGREVELRFAVRCRAGPGPRPGLRRHAKVEVTAGSLRPEVLPTPQPDEVMTVAAEKLEIAGEVVLVRFVGAVAARAEAVLKVVPDV
jgi:hypothetical protein